MEATKTRFRWSVHDVDQRLLVAAQHMDDDRQKMIVEKRSAAGSPAVHFGVVCTGNKSIAKAEVLEDYHETWDRLIGTEMEAGGAAMAALQSPQKPGFFMIRGVSDMADEHERTAAVANWRPYARDVAAAFAVAHGCRAGLHQRALDEVYWPRINRKDKFFSTNQLGSLRCGPGGPVPFLRTALVPTRAGTDQWRSIFSSELGGLSFARPGPPSRGG